MQLQTMLAAAQEGDFPVYFNPGNGDGAFGIIVLTEQHALFIETDEDADRIIRAAERIKKMRAAMGTPHDHEPGAGRWGNNCVTCGLLRKAHAEPDAEPNAA